MSSGIVLLDKPSGMTSRRADAIVARIFGAKTFGHIGTLDPMASGLLAIALGNATKMIPYLECDNKKEYQFAIRWGIQTDTLDITGTIIESNPDCQIPTTAQLQNACNALVGQIMQTPPQYSAISVNGVRAYKLARAGKIAEIPPRPITIYDLRFVVCDSGEIIFNVKCSAGTYIRVLVQQIIENLNCKCIGTTSMIRRVATNGFIIKNAVSLDFLENLYNNAPDTVLGYLKPVDYGLDDIPVFNLVQTDADVFLHGGFISVTGTICGLRRVYQGNQFLGIGNLESGVLKPKRVIN